jgi:hypothetical protein
MTEIPIVHAADAAAPAAAAGTCVLCHTVDGAITHADLDAGVNWRCSRCGQTWDAARLAAAAAYADYVATH